ncbi:putative ABC transporter permease, partial [Eubacteriales bacterium OttesenSCG-928-N13]|nr:putative ABC transporter permease [Eubacteriales bacterium OttesenSCG-928-N13]
MISIGYAQAIIYFALYSFVGWVMETIICSIQSKRFVNRGFLFGPWCPIYGVGVLLILMITQSFVQYPALVFLVALLSTTALEYFTGWL